MIKSLVAAAGLLCAAAVPALAQEQAIAPYVQSNANAGAGPIGDPKLLAAFHGEEGVRRIVHAMHERNLADPRISDIFKGHDNVRLERTLYEQFCYLLGGSCAYSGRDMKTSHKDLGLQTADLTALVENLQWAMDQEGVPFAAQNRLLAKLAPMKSDVIER